MRFKVTAVEAPKCNHHNIATGLYAAVFKYCDESEASGGKKANSVYQQLKNLYVRPSFGAKVILTTNQYKI